jgi:ssDNA-binding Zn-finger/Zn-ribbon topoisomerase 1
VCPTCGTALGGAGAALGVLAVGQQLAGGSYSVGRLLGRGGFGITYLGADNRLARQIALKEFFPAGAMRHGTTVVPPSTLPPRDYAAATERFLQEGQILARFHHPSIVAVHAVFQENATAYMIMEYLRGETLAQRLERDGKPLPEAEIVALARPLAEALERIHAAGLLHRDIKPENIILANGATPLRPVLIDFGAAREFVQGVTIRQSVVLTPGYAPLEQYGERAQRGPYSDIYAFAATLYHLATGVQPAAAIDRAVGIELQAARELNPKLSRSFERALLRGLQMKVDDRPQSALEFWNELVAARRATQSGPATQSGGDSANLQAIAAPHRMRIEAIARELALAAVVQTERLRCPVCRDATMVEPHKASGPIRCPVCRAAGLKERIPAREQNRCPVCRMGTLHLVKHGGLLRCPACQVGMVRTYVRKRKLFVFADTGAKCDACAADWSFDGWRDTLTLVDLPPGSRLAPDLQGQTKPRQAWAELSGRASDEHYQCDHCRGELDPRPGKLYQLVAVGRDLAKVPIEHQSQQRTMAQWAKIAHNIPLNEGTHICPACNAQLDTDGEDKLVLLRAPSDPRHIRARYGVMARPAPAWRAIAAGMRQVDKPGCICPACTAEMEAVEGGQYRLAAFDRARDPYGTGAAYLYRSLEREDWGRIAAGKPSTQREQKLRREAQEEFWAGLLEAELGDPAAEHSYPAGKSGGEQPLVKVAADFGKETKGGVQPYDSGPLWITTKKVFFQGKRVNLAIPLDKINACAAYPRGGFASDLLSIRRVDRARPLLFAASGKIAYAVDGLSVEIPWSAQRGVELINTLRRKNDLNRQDAKNTKT